MAGLNTADAHFIASIKLPSDLTDDLKAKEDDAEKPWSHRALVDVALILDVLKHVTQFFLLSMRPVAVELGLIWGLLHLTVKVDYCFLHQLL